LRSRLLFLLIWFTSAATADIYSRAIDGLEFELLAKTYNDSKVAGLLADYGKKLSKEERQAAAVLISIGALHAEDLANSTRAGQKLVSYQRVLDQQHTALMGRIGDASLLTKLVTRQSYDELLSANDILEQLGEELAKGVITGYDLRMKGVYDGFPESRTFIYSHSSLLHMRQLVTLLESEDVNGWVYLTPKVSAFLFRDDWGPATNAVVTLPGGLRVVQGREFAVLFQFDTAQDRVRFHEVITRFAKKDIKDEPGLIADAWWQPFYYTHDRHKGFKQISLVVLTSDRYEVTLTVLNENIGSVLNAVGSKPWPHRVEQVWVNPPFYRFLHGDFR